MRWSWSRQILSNSRLDFVWLVVLQYNNRSAPRPTIASLYLRVPFGRTSLGLGVQSIAELRYLTEVRSTFVVRYPTA